MIKTKTNSLLDSIHNQRGATIITTVLAAATIIGSIAGTMAASMYLSNSLRKSEATNLAVMLESNLITAFNNKNNYPNSIAAQLRPGATTSLTTLPLGTAIGVLNVPVLTKPAGGPAPATAGAIGYLNRDFASCSPDFSNKNCYLKYEVRLQKFLITGNLYGYSFAYQIDANPEIVKMSPLGNRTAFDTAIDPGNYRSDYSLTICDRQADLFMNGYNRDSGESFCIEKPKISKCPDQRLPKGLIFSKFTGQAKAGSVELLCTTDPMRTYSCPQNYSLLSFDPRYADPDFPKANLSPPNEIGKCVFRTASTATMPGSYPSNPTSPYLRTIAGTVCPPFYKVKSGSFGCNLVPNASRNSTYGVNQGLGRCGSTGYRDCKRFTYTDTPDPVPHQNWVNCKNTLPTYLPSPPAPAGTQDMSKPPNSCGPEPANPVITRTCSFTENSVNCNGVADVPTTCTTFAGWTGGIAYAYNIQDVPPSAKPNVTTSGRNITCSFGDTSTTCSAPDTLFNGSTYGKKNPKWYGGVQLSGTVCEYDPSLGSPEVVDAN